MCDLFAITVSTVTWHTLIGEKPWWEIDCTLAIVLRWHHTAALLSARISYDLILRGAQLNTCVAYTTRSCRICRTHAIIVCNNSLFMTPWDSFLSSVRDLKFKQLKVRSVKLVLVIVPCTLQIYLQIFCSYLQYTILSILLVVFLRLDLSGILINLYFVESVLPQYV